MKIMFSVLCLSYGGAEKNLCIVANGLVARGHEVIVCNMNHMPTVQKLDERIKVFDIPKYTGRTKRLKQLSYMKKICKSERPQLLVSFLFMPNFLTTILGKMMRIPVIISERADPNQHRDRIGRFVHKVYSVSDGAVFQTEGAKACYPKKLQDKSRVIPNPVFLKDDGIFADYESCRKAIVFSGRFELKQKRQDIALEAFRIIHGKHPEYVLDFYGDGPDEDAMKAYAAELGLADCVNFNGVSYQLHKEEAASEIFMMSSDFEGIPNVLLEAMALGLPCVSTDCSPGGARMLINDGKDGLIVPCGDPKALADAVCRMIEDREFAVRCGKNALAVRERFSFDRILDSWEEFCIEKAKK